MSHVAHEMRRPPRLRTRRLSNAFYYLTAATALASALQPGLGWAGRVAILATPFAIVLVHELGHVLVAMATGRRVVEMMATPWEGRTVVGAPNPKDFSWILVAAAGSVFASVFAAGALFAIAGHGTALGGLAPWLELVCIVSLVESAGNLLPFGELDGQRIHSTIQRLSADRAGRPRRIAEPAATPPAYPHGIAWALSFLNEEMERPLEAANAAERDPVSDAAGP